MKRRALHVLLALVLLTLMGCTSFPTASSTPVPPADPSPRPTLAASPDPTAESGPVPQASPASTSPADPFALLSQEHLLATITDLTAIQPYSGWRNSASEGEAEALDYVAGQLDGMVYLNSLGLSLERQTFHVFLGMDLWQTRLVLTLGGQQVEVPADGLRGPRDDVAQALRFDSDGVLNDSNRDPLTADGPVLVVRSAAEIRALNRDEVQGRVVFLDYAVIDRVLVEQNQAVGLAAGLLEKDPAGLVLVTTNSNEPGESHGTFVGDGSAVTWVDSAPLPPTLYVRLEDLAPAGIESWDDLARVESARLTWDADVFSPANSGNLIAHVPGTDTSQALILGAHIDSPDAPGALDDGSGSAILLEVARVLDEAQVQPPIDLYLCWFGSEELGLYGSSHFVATHGELLDRTRAMLQIDMLGHPLDGLPADLKLVTWSYAGLGDSRLLWPDYLVDLAAQQGVEAHSEDVPYTYSDNNSFGGLDVPHADLIYEADAYGSVHYATHIHDPYDTVELAREMGNKLEEMARVVLAAALEPPVDLSAVRVTTRPDRRALFVASHTEAVHMTPIVFRELGMALAMDGFDVDLVPYGQPVTPADLADADLVVVLPVFDYPGPQSDPAPYDEAWTPEELAALEDYAAGGGLLVLTNSAYRLKYGNAALDPNEDWPDANDLAGRFGVTFLDGYVPGYQADIEGDHVLVRGVRNLELSAGNGVPFVVDGDGAQVLAQAVATPVVSLLDFGSGQVLVLADVAILTSAYGEALNLPFWRNLADYARSR